MSMVGRVQPVHMRQGRGSYVTWCGRRAGNVYVAASGDWPAVTCAECKRLGDDR